MIIRIKMYMGFRIGEVLALKKIDIDLMHNLIKVVNTLKTCAYGKINKNLFMDKRITNSSLKIKKRLLK